MDGSRPAAIGISGVANEVVLEVFSNAIRRFLDAARVSEDRAFELALIAGRDTPLDLSLYSPVSNIGDIWSLEEGSDEGSIVLDIGEVGLNAFLQHFV